MYKISGKEISEQIMQRIKNDIDKYSPIVNVIYAGNDTSTLSYIKSKQKKADKYGIKLILKQFNENIDAEVFYREIENASQDNSIHGIIVEKPLPKQINIKKVSQIIDYKKDIDCINPYNLGKLITDDILIAPSTAMAVINTLELANIETQSKDIIIIGRSEIVGKPLTLLLESKNKNATVTLCHSKTKYIREKTKNADIIITAIGKANFLTKDFLGNNKPVLIDVGINYYNGKLCGDIAKECYELSSYYTPVPGGIGPVTVSTLFENTIKLIKYYE